MRNRLRGQLTGMPQGGSENLLLSQILVDEISPQLPLANDEDTVRDPQDFWQFGTDHEA